MMVSHGPVHAVPWNCAVCAKNKKNKKTCSVPKTRIARKLEAKVNAEKDDAASPNSSKCEAGTVLADVQATVKKSRGGRPISPRPNLYVGSDSEWRALGRERRKAFSKTIKRRSRNTPY
jgi:hypothetical protein